MSGTSMASPHVAGLLAYLLSLYPSKVFNPELTPDLTPESLLSIQAHVSFGDVYKVAHSALPGWLSSFLPPPRLVEDVVAPIPDEPTLTPLQLKKALLALSTKNVLSSLPDETPNLLVFNNATSS